MRDGEGRTRRAIEIRLQTEKVERARSEVDRWFKIDRDRWQQTEQFHDALSAMYPRDWSATVLALQHDEPDAVEPAIVFLHADPRCLRSGYEREQLRQFLGRSELTDRQRRRLLAIPGPASLDTHRPQRERSTFARLEAKLGVATTMDRS